MKPGITGYSQAYFRNSDESYDKMIHDVYYAENISFILDMRIVFKTIMTVLKHENLYREEDNVSRSQK